MRLASSTLASIFLINSALLLSPVYSVRSGITRPIDGHNFCTEKYCEDCSSGEILKCSNGAVSERCGDLCGCCYSCVRYQDSGEPCGSQLAVRSSENLEDSKARLIILATTNCRQDLICRNFICVEKNDEFYQNKTLSKQSINLEANGKEFELIYGNGGLADLNFLIKSVGKNSSDSMMNENEGKILYEGLREIFRAKDSKEIEASGIPKILRRRFLLRAFRKKRDLDRMENWKIEEHPRRVNGTELEETTTKEYRGISVYDIVNKTPKQMEDFSHWLVARKLQIHPEERSVLEEGLKNDKIESEINIRITGVPKPADVKNVLDNDTESVESQEKLKNSEILITDANTDVPKILAGADENSINITTSAVFENVFETDRINGASNDWSYPVTLDSNYYGEVDVVVNETVDEIKAQLDRIETREIVIENAVYDMIDKIEFERKYGKMENRDSREKNMEDAGIVERRSNDGFEGNYPRRGDGGENYLSWNENSTIVARPRLEEEPRSSRQWRTVKIRPKLSEASNVWRIARRRPDRGEQNRFIDRKPIARWNRESGGQGESNPRRETSFPRGSGSVKIFRDGRRISGQRKLPIFLSRGDPNSEFFFNYQRDDPQLFSYDRSNRELNLHSTQEGRAWPFNLVLNRAVPADRRARKIAEEIGIRDGNLNSENPVVKESVVLLETQIPKSTKSGTSITSGDRFRRNWKRFLRNYNEDYDDSFRRHVEELPGNLFVTDIDEPESGMTFAESRIPEGFVLPIKNVSEDNHGNRESEEKLAIRSKRSASTSDWLKAAEEYHELLRRVRNAAMKTLLASQEELAVTNLTNVKLFRRDVPAYLEEYDPTNFHDIFDDALGVGRMEDYTADSSKISTDSLSVDTSSRNNHSRVKTNVFSEVSSSSEPRKFTIITNGNSTIRIEEIFKDPKEEEEEEDEDEDEDEDDDAWFEDQLAESSTGSLTRALPRILNQEDYFDHMYESFDADDEDFDYADGGSTISRLLERVDRIGLETPEDGEKIVEDSNRFKRDAPLFLFKVKGNSKGDVLIWPSNWRALMARHSKRNDNGPTPRTMTESLTRTVEEEPENHTNKIPASQIETK